MYCSITQPTVPTTFISKVKEIARNFGKQILDSVIESLLPYGDNKWREAKIKICNINNNKYECILLFI